MKKRKLDLLDKWSDYRLSSVEFRNMLNSLSLGCILLMSSCNLYDCTNEILEEAFSKNKNYKIVKFIRDCGATTIESIQISVLRSDQQLRKDQGGNLFIVDGPVRNEQIEIEWKNKTEVLIKYPVNNRVIKNKNSYEEIKISYQIKE